MDPSSEEMTETRDEWGREAPSRELPWFLRRRHGWLARMLPWHRPRVRVAAVIGSDSRPLRHWENWRRIVPAMNALVDLLPKPATIRPEHYREGRRRQIPYGLMRWNEENNRRWTAGAEEPDLYMRKTEIWSPARSSTIEMRRYPDFYALIDGGQSVDRQGFALALRLDLLPGLAAAADAVVAEVEALIPDSRRLIADRTWEERRILGVIRENNLDDAISLDAFEWAEANPHRQFPAFSSPR